MAPGKLDKVGRHAERNESDSGKSRSRKGNNKREEELQQEGEKIMQEMTESNRFLHKQHKESKKQVDIVMKKCNNEKPSLKS